MDKSARKKICWVTASYMLQVDLPILSKLNEEFEIDWYYWGNKATSSYELAETFAKENNIHIFFIEKKYWTFNPIGYFFQTREIKKLAQKKYSIYYFDISTFPWLLFVIKSVLPANRVVLAMHHGKPHSGMRFKFLYFPFLKYLNRQPFYLQYFSNSQAEAFSGSDINRKFIIPLAVNDFGSSEISPEPDKVTFTSFGNVIPTKNISLLIEAGNRLWKKYPNRFKINIVGHCRNWKELYENLIEFPEAFRLDIRRIKESEISGLFASTNYLVLPYKAVTQSGPLRIAYGYNVPVIASNLEGFKESVIDGITGLLFESENVDSLCNVMSNVIEQHPNYYNKIKERQIDFVNKNLSIQSICDQYSSMLNRIIENNEY